VVWINSRTTPELMECWTRLLPASLEELKTQAELFAWGFLRQRGAELAEVLWKHSSA
jgi:hypothetical protein